MRQMNFWNKFIKKGGKWWPHADLLNVEMKNRPAEYA
jgi:hypothetical protein